MNWRFFKHKSADLVLAANEVKGCWLTRDDYAESYYDAHHAESFVINRIYDEIKTLPDWAEKQFALYKAL